METQFTPGPWEVCRGNKGSIFGDLDNPKLDGDNPYIGKVAGIGTDDDYPEHIANANLIAAAPDLFEAAQYAVECLERLNTELGQIGDNGDQAYNALKAAISKVIGQPHSPMTNQ